MKILLVRHAAALARGTPGVLDAERPLTSTGTAAFRVAARGLARILGQVDVFVTSPLTRARETAEIAAIAFRRPEPVVEIALAGKSLDAAIAALTVHRHETTVAVVGHEPMLRALLARMLGAPDAERFAFRKGAAALVALPDGPAATGNLLWFLTPRVLQALGDAEAFVPTVQSGNGGPVVRNIPS